MDGTYVAPVKTPCTPEQYAQAVELALGGDGKVPEGMLAVLMAQSALESGRWQAMWNFNCSNIKASPVWKGRYTSIRLNEYLVRDGRRQLIWFSPEGEEVGGTSKARGSIKPGTESPVPPGHSQTHMRAFETLAEGVADKFRFLQTVRYASAWRCAIEGDAVNFVKALHGAGYFTANLQPYIDGVTSLAKSYKLIARRVATEPLPLPAAEEEHVEVCIELCSRGLQYFEYTHRNIPFAADVDWDEFARSR